MHIESQGACLGDSVRAAGAAQARLGLRWLERALSSVLWRSQWGLPLVSRCELASRGEWVASLRSRAGFGKSTHLSPQPALYGLWVKEGAVTARSALLAEPCRGIWGVGKTPGLQSCAGGAIPALRCASVVSPRADKSQCQSPEENQPILLSCLSQADSHPPGNISHHHP